MRKRRTVTRMKQAGNYYYYYFLKNSLLFLVISFDSVARCWQLFFLYRYIISLAVPEQPLSVVGRQ